jgi:glycerol-3-phosphate acyltransferase PlsY
MASVATLTGCTTALVLLLLFAWRGSVPSEYTVYGVVQLVLVAIALRPNIERILKGTERRVSFGRSGPQT